MMAVVMAMVMRVHVEVSTKRSHVQCDTWRVVAMVIDSRGRGVDLGSLICRKE